MTSFTTGLRGALAVLGLLAATSLAASPAHADTDSAKVCHTVPALPDECLSDATIAYITSVQQDYASTRQILGTVILDRQQVTEQLWQTSADLQAARTQATIDAATIEAWRTTSNRYERRWLVSQSKVRELRKELKGCTV